MSGDKRTIVELGTHLEGSLTSSCPVVLNGKLDGEMSGPSLEVSATGSVKGKIKVEQIVCDGEMSGEFDADVVRLSGVVHDESIVRAKSLEVKLAGANGQKNVTFGSCSLEVGELPDKEAIIRASRDGRSLRPAEPAERIDLADSGDELPDGLPMGEGRSASKRKGGAPARR